MHAYVVMIGITDRKTGELVGQEVIKTVAYSVGDAALQAIYEVSFRTDDRCTCGVAWIGPDWDLAVQRAKDAIQRALLTLSKTVEKPS